MVRVKIGTDIREYPQGTTWAQVAEEYQSGFEHDILAGTDWWKAPGTSQDRQGRQSALYHCRGKAGNVRLSAQRYPADAKRPSMQWPGQNGVEKGDRGFFRRKGFFRRGKRRIYCGRWFLEQVKAKMEEYVNRKIPIQKRSVSTDDAIELFHDHHMYDKERLFRYRRVSRVEHVQH